MAKATDPTMQAIHRMLNPASVAVVGATERMQYGGRFVRALLRASDRVKVYPVNPKYHEVMGVKCYPSVKELPEAPDVVGIVVPYSRVMSVLEDCAERGAATAVVITAGFAERGSEEGEVLQRQIRDFAHQSGVRVCGPNCIGLVNRKSNLAVTAYSQPVEGLSGPIALVSQSGGNAFGPLLSRAGEWGVGFSYIVSTGNEADLESSDYIRYLLDDPDTKVIACFIEGFKDARKFLEVARQAQERGKPIVMIKVGRSDVGTRAARSHTAALTGSEPVHQAVFKQYGILRAEDYDELIHMSHLLAFSPAPPADGVAVISHSGGISSLVADKCGEVGLDLPDLNEETRSALDEVLKGFGWAANPADVTGHANNDETLPRILELMINQPHIGALTVASGLGENQARHVVELRKSASKPVSFLWTGGRSTSAGLKILRDANVPVFYQPGEMARALKSMFEYHRRREQFLNRGPGLAAVMSSQQQDELGRLSSLGRQTLTEHETKELLACWGIPVTVERRAVTLEEAAVAAREVGYPVVLKVESPDILHKTDAGLVRVGIENDKSLRAAYDEIMSGAQIQFPSADVQGVLVQEMVKGGAEVIVGVSRDSQFGPVILFGIGGVLVEVYEDVALRVCPITEGDAQEMIQEVKGAKILQGYRGQPPADMCALIDVLMRVSNLATSLEDRLVELDINPLVVLPAGQGAKALDALAVLAKSR